MLNCSFCLIHVKYPLLIYKLKCNGTIIQMQWYNIVEELQILRIDDVIFSKIKQNNSM